MKKYALAVGLSLLALSACGKQGETQEKSTESKAQGAESAENAKEDGDSETLSVQIWDANQEPGIKEILGALLQKPEFRPKYPSYVGQITGLQWRPLHRVDSFLMSSGCTPMNPNVT